MTPTVTPAAVSANTMTPAVLSYTNSDKIPLTWYRTYKLYLMTPGTVSVTVPPKDTPAPL